MRHVINPRPSPCGPEPPPAHEPRLPRPPDDRMTEAFRWRSIGPANPGRRLTDVDGIPRPTKTFFVAGAVSAIGDRTFAQSLSATRIGDLCGQKAPSEGAGRWFP